MRRVAGLVTGALIGMAALSGTTDARTTRPFVLPAGVVSDGFTAYAGVARIGVGGEIRFERGAALKARPAALARPVSALHAEWRT